MSVPHTTYEAYVPRVMAYLEKAPEALVKDRLRDAVRMFLRETSALTITINAERQKDTTESGKWFYTLNTSGYELCNIQNALVKEGGSTFRLKPSFYANQQVNVRNETEVIVYTQTEPYKEVQFDCALIPTADSEFFPTYIADRFHEAILAKLCVLMGDYARNDRNWEQYYMRTRRMLVSELSTPAVVPIGLVFGEPQFPGYVS